MNYKRKRPKEYSIHYCGYRHCKYDVSKYAGNGRERYLPSYWRRFGGRHVWRYVHKNAPLV